MLLGALIRAINIQHCVNKTDATLPSFNSFHSSYDLYGTAACAPVISNGLPSHCKQQRVGQSLTEWRVVILVVIVLCCRYCRSYIVVAPKTVRPGATVKISVTTFRAISDVDVRAEVVARGVVRASARKTVAPSTCRACRAQCSDIDKGSLFCRCSRLHRAAGMKSRESRYFTDRNLLIILFLNIIFKYYF